MKCFVALLALVALSHGYSLGYNRNMMIPTGYNMIHKNFQPEFMDMNMKLNSGNYVNQDYFTQESWPRKCEQVFRQLKIFGILGEEDQVTKMVEEVRAAQYTMLSPDQKIESIFTVLKHHGVMFTRETVPVITRCMLTVICGQDFYPIHQLEELFKIFEQYGMQWNQEYATHLVRCLVIKSNNLPVQYLQELLHLLQARFGLLNNEVVKYALKYVCHIHKDAVYPIQNIEHLLERIERVGVHFDQQKLIAFFQQLEIVEKSIIPIYKKVQQLVNFFQIHGVSHEQEIVVPCVKLVLDMTHDKNITMHKQICQLLELLHAYGMPMKLYYVEAILEHFLNERRAVVLPMTREGINGLLMTPEIPFEIKKTLKQIEINNFKYPPGSLYHGMPREYFTHELNNQGQGMWNQKYEHYPTVYGLNQHMGPYQYQQQPLMWNQKFQHQTPYHQVWQRMMMQNYPAMNQYAY